MFYVLYSGLCCLGDHVTNCVIASDTGSVRFTTGLIYRQIPEYSTQFNFIKIKVNVRSRVKENLKLFMKFVILFFFRF